MSSAHNNPITNAVDFISHGTKETAIGNIENIFDVSQTGSLADPKNVALSGFSTQSDMLTSAYFNSEVGDLRQNLAAYQIKTYIDNGDMYHRAIFVGGVNKRALDPSNNPITTTINVDINVGNYPNDVADTNTNTGKSAKLGEGIPNMELKGNTFTGDKTGNFPIYPIDRHYQEANWPTSGAGQVDIEGTLSLYEKQTSIFDIRDTLCCLFGLDNLNLGFTLKDDYSSVLGGQPLVIGGTHVTEFPHNVYVSLTSAVTQWVKLCAIKVTTGNSKLLKVGAGENHSGVAQNLKKTDGTDAPAIEYCESLKVELVIDGQYCPRQLIGNGMSHQQLFVWTEGKLGQTGRAPTFTQEDSCLQFTFSDYLVYGDKIAGCKRFNIDEIRDRYSMFQLLSHIGQIYRTSTGLSLPIKLVEYMSQVSAGSSLTNILYYISLAEMYAMGDTSTIDAGKRLNQIFNFLQNDNNYYSHLQGGNYGIALRYWNDEKDCVETGDDARFTCLNTNDADLIDPEDGTVGTYKSRNTLRVNKVKHVVVTNLPGFKNGRYGTSMTSSNLINGFFGSLSIDLSYSDTHTPVDINGMTVHQWDIDNVSTTIFGGQNNPARWNVNANEEYRKLLTQASVNC